MNGNTEELRIWHPEVHLRFRESLYYCFCRVRPYVRQTFLEWLEQRVTKLDVAGYCAYEIYGDFDVLLRLWLPMDREDTFEQSLARDYPELRHIVPFKVTSVRHYWPWAGVPELTEGLGRLTTSLVERVQEDNAGAIAEAESCGLLRREHRSDRVKFFISLSEPLAVSSTAETALLHEVERILRERTDDELARRSLYVGFGAAWAVMKGEVRPEDYFGIGRLVQELTEALSLHGSYTTTYLITGGVVRERDEISQHSLTEMSGKDLEVDLLLPELYALPVDTQTRQRVQTWVRQYVLAHDLGLEERRCLRLALAGVIAGRPEDSESALFAWFRSTEAFLTRHWQRFAGTRLGQKEPVEVIRGAGIPKDRAARPFTLGDLLRICQYLLTQAGLSTGIAWPGNPEALAELRNKIVHGRFEWKHWSDELAVLPPWMSTLRKVREAMVDDSPSGAAETDAIEVRERGSA
jgi:hypothetical protein